MFIEIATGAYPLSEGDIREAFPNTSFPEKFSAPDGYADVQLTEPPSFDPITQFVVEDAPTCDAAGAYHQTWRVAARPADEASAASREWRASLIAQIDADVDAIYKGVLGERAEEYTTAQEQAQAFKAAGYAGGVPDSVQSWADAKGWTAQQAADDILATAATWQDARAQIRAARLLRKEQIRAATSDAAAQTAMGGWCTFRDSMRSQLGLPSAA